MFILYMNLYTITRDQQLEYITILPNKLSTAKKSISEERILCKIYVYTYPIHSSAAFDASYFAPL